MTRAMESRSKACLVVVLAVVLSFLSPPPAAAAREGELEQVESNLREDEARARALAEEVEALRREIKVLRQKMTAAARKAQDLEERLTTGEDRLRDLEARRAEKLEVLESQHSRLATTLTALQRIARRPPEAVILAPGSPADTYRSALLLSRAIPEFEGQADALRAELLALDDLRNRISLEQQELSAARQALTEERRGLSALLAHKRRLEGVVSAQRRAARARVERWAREAKGLREFLDKLETEAKAAAERERLAEAERQQERERLRRAMAEEEDRRREAPEATGGSPVEEPESQTQQAALPETEPGAETAGPPETQTAALAAPPVSLPLEKPANVRAFPASPDRAGLVMPARGRLAGLFGEPRTDGVKDLSQGISIRTRALAQVVAPYDGKVAYAGQFRRYGQILIIEHGGRYHTLLAGLTEVYAVEGQWVLAGEPVGTMGEAEGAAPILYLELRQGGQPINPLPWLATTDNKVQG